PTGRPQHSRRRGAGQEAPQHAPQRGHRVVHEISRRGERCHRVNDLAGGGEQPSGHESDSRSHLPQHHDQQREEETLPATPSTARPGRPSIGYGEPGDIGGGIDDRFGYGHQPSRSVVKVGSNRSSSTAGTSTSAPVSPACWSASPAPRIDSYWASPRAGVVKLVRASCASATSIDSPAASARI